ncbi:MAG: hypothetical protein R3D25_07620 [Geminicoccaceae bacterium]
MAEAAGTIGYELLTRLGHRFRRVYLNRPAHDQSLQATGAAFIGIASTVGGSASSPGEALAMASSGRSTGASSGAR